MPQEVIKKNHMDVAWHEYTDENGGNVPVVDSSIAEKASIIGRVGIMFLSCGTGAWRVRSSMNTLAEALGITCTEDIGLMSIEYTCYDGENGFTQSLCLTNTGVNTLKLNRLEHFIRNFEKEGKHMSGEQLHTFLDNIEKTHGLYSPPALGLAAAIACCGFTFLLGGGPIEMFCAFVGAGIGNYLRCKLTKHHFTLFLCIVSSVSLACFAYAGLLKLGEILFGISVQHEAGYICAMLFIIPGFPFITSGIDLAKLDMRSGIERLTYALIVILVATMSAWIMALILHLKPVDFIKLSLSTEQWILFRLLASFCGVFG
ncbi:MAG: threonine/serine exporter family protein, partial [Ruminococcus sp.]|nr:threonine/serine exporter family protein [Ruminococcus sp.]